jgi:hypothetical protein
LKVGILIFIQGLLAAGPIVAQESATSSSRTFTAAEAGFNLDYGGDRMERAIDERTIYRLGLFDRPDDGGSARYSVSLDLEHDDSDWSFDVTVTVDF